MKIKDKINYQSDDGIKKGNNHHKQVHGSNKNWTKHGLQGDGRYENQETLMVTMAIRTRIMIVIPNVNTINNNKDGSNNIDDNKKGDNRRIVTC